MRFTRTRKRAAAAVIAAVAMAGIGVGTASSAQAASEGTYSFGTGGCSALEIIQLGGDGHDYMAIDPTANPGHCLFGVFNLNTWSWAYGATSSGAESPYIYDGPGQSLKACLIDTANNNTWACGPAN
ncbi:hypothetical protein [Kitasatospora kifunensis]|uniref:Secreted protein n=1 Tax=Kitasatospora kifunensis TaxID=58351 RepID=A0A7W7VT20_KITKI|nr:hypothetical protein [Kitasatospora kifunensis]MBB4921328.1 hypothetical protein [Kitasatospora kifunensis]